MAESNAKSIAVLILTIVLAVFFVLAGGSKFVGMQLDWAQNFDHWGYPGWFLYLIGIVELIGAAFLVIPSIAIFGAVVLGTIMFGAFWTHVANGEVPGMIVTIVLFVLFVSLGRLRLQPFLKRFPFE